MNNEPFLDKRIVGFYSYARKKLPKSYLYVFTNGILLDKDKLLGIGKYVDLIVVNNYCTDMKLRPNIKEIADFVKSNPDILPHATLRIQMRYSRAVLVNRSLDRNTSANQQ